MLEIDSVEIIGGSALASDIRVTPRLLGEQHKSLTPQLTVADDDSYSVPWVAK